MKSISTLLIVVFSFSLLGQENQGAVQDNFNPVNGQYINPSNIVDSKVWLDINFIGSNIYGQNNLIYYPNSNWLSAGSFDQNPLVRTDLRNVRLYSDIELRGPAVSFNIAGHGFSVFSNLRGIVNVNRMPGQLAKYLVDGSLETSDIGSYQVNNARIKSMIWGEVGVTYGKILFAKSRDMWTGAISVKRLFGVFQTNLLIDQANVDVLAVDDVVLNSINGEFSSAAGAEEGFSNGGGWGINLGTTFKKMKAETRRYVPHWKKANCECQDYLYKIGLSLLDVGFINFNEESFFGEFDQSLDLEENNTVEEITSEFTSNNSGSGFNSWLPAAASVQFDYNVNDFIYLNGTIIQRFPFFANTFGVERTNLLAVSARFESRFFGAAIPLSLQNYVNPQVGLGLRFFNLTIGSDDILPILTNQQELKSGDFYFAMKFKIFRNPACKTKGKGRKRGGKKNSVDCPAFG